jgi:hypothetical protein
VKAKGLVLIYSEDRIVLLYSLGYCALYVYFLYSYFIELLTNCSLIGTSINKAIILKISLISSSLEYYILALSYIKVYNNLLNPI